MLIFHEEVCASTVLVLVAYIFHAPKCPAFRVLTSLTLGGGGAKLPGPMCSGDPNQLTQAPFESASEL